MESTTPSTDLNSTIIRNKAALNEMVGSSIECGIVRLFLELQTRFYTSMSDITEETIEDARLIGTLALAAARVTELHSRSITPGTVLESITLSIQDHLHLTKNISSAEGAATEKAEPFTTVEHTLRENSRVITTLDKNSIASSILLAFFEQQNLFYQRVLASHPDVTEEIKREALLISYLALPAVYAATSPSQKDLRSHTLGVVDFHQRFLERTTQEIQNVEMGPPIKEIKMVINTRLQDATIMQIIQSKGYNSVNTLVIRGTKNFLNTAHLDAALVKCGTIHSLSVERVGNMHLLKIAEKTARVKELRLEQIAEPNLDTFSLFADKCDDLEHLSFMNSDFRKLTPAAVQLLVTKYAEKSQGLISLNLSNTNLTDDQVRQFAEASQGKLTSLNISGTQFTPPTLNLFMEKNLELEEVRVVDQRKNIDKPSNAGPSAAKRGYGEVSGGAHFKKTRKE